jgi:hypothetical protein
MGPRDAGEHLTEALEAGELVPSDFDFAELFEAYYGQDGRDALRPGGSVTRMMEAVDGTDSTHFLDITNRVISAAVIADYEKETSVAAQLISNTPNVVLRHERLPGVTELESEGDFVQEGMPYETQGFGAKWQDFGDGRKFGLITAVTRETLHFVGQTAEIIRRASGIGARLGMNKERRIWRMIYGIGTDFNPYDYTGTTYNTYQNAAAGAPWINIHANDLVDWTDLDLASRLWDVMTNPDNGDPIVIGGATILVQPARTMQARMILTATEVRQTTNAVNQINTNPIQGVTLGPESRLGRQVLATGGLGIAPEILDRLWLYGDFKRAFTYRENWPITVTQEPPNAAAEFEQDIVSRWKASERGHPTVLDPRYVLITTGQTDHSSSGDVLADPDSWPGNNSAWS